jgi:hypothetical protein
MHTDIYTKLVLTIIAITLTILVLQNSIGNAIASGNNVQKVAICNEQGTICADVWQTQGGDKRLTIGGSVRALTY